MANTNKIVLSGYYGFDNIGDEAVLYSIVALLKKEIPHIHITVLSNNPEKTKEVYGVDSVNRWDIKKIAKVIKESDMLISGGGSLLQDTTSNKTIPYYLGVVRLAQFYKKKVVFYSQGIGPVSKGFNKWLIKRIVNKVDGIFVREPASKVLLETMGIKKPIHVAIDPVIGISTSQKEKEVAQSKSVGIYIRPWQNDEQLLESLEKGLQYLLKEGYTLYLIPMHYEQDKEIAYTLKKRLGEVEKVIVVDKKLSIDEVVSYTASFEFIIGMRLHSLIMAAATKVPMLGISYDPKVKDFMKEMELPYHVTTEAITPEDFTKMVKELIRARTEQKAHLEKIYELKKEKVYLPVNYIKELLNK